MVDFFCGSSWTGFAASTMACPGLDSGCSVYGPLSYRREKLVLLFHGLDPLCLCRLEPTPSTQKGKVEIGREIWLTGGLLASLVFDGSRVVESGDQQSGLWLGI